MKLLSVGRSHVVGWFHMVRNPHMKPQMQKHGSFPKHGSTTKKTVFWTCGSVSETTSKRKDKKVLGIYIIYIYIYIWTYLQTCVRNSVIHPLAAFPNYFTPRSCFTGDSSLEQLVHLLPEAEHTHTHTHTQVQKPCPYSDNYIHTDVVSNGILTVDPPMYPIIAMLIHRKAHAIHQL